MDLIVTDNRAWARELAHTLCGSSVLRADKGYFEGTNAVVTWFESKAFRLAEAEEYDSRYKRWHLSDLPIAPRAWRYQVRAESWQALQALKQAVGTHEFDRAVIAGSPSGDGERQARLALSYAQWEKPKAVYRFWTARPISASEIRLRMAALVPSKEWDGVCARAESLDRLEWLIGTNVSRFLSLRMGVRCRFGRLGALVLRLLVNGAAGRSEPPDAGGGEARGFANLTDLAVTANRRWGLAPSAVLGSADRLYEYHHCISYPRSCAHNVGRWAEGVLSESIRFVTNEHARVCAEISPLRVRQVLVTSEAGDEQWQTPIFALGTLRSWASSEERRLYELIVEGMAKSLGGWKGNREIENRESATGTVTDADVLAALGECGVGSVTGRSYVVDRLVRAGYAARASRWVHATDAGKRMLDACEAWGLAELLDLSKAAEWEEKISSGGAAVVSEVASVLERSCGLSSRSKDPRPIGNAAYWCPACGGLLRESVQSYHCTRSGCAFRVAKVIKGHRVTASDLEAVTKVAGGRGPIATFRTSGGGSARGRLFYDVGRRRVAIDFEGPRWGGMIRSPRRTG